MTTITILNRVLAEMSISKIASILSVAEGTIKRWIDLGKIPSAYEIDLLRILNEPIDYTKYSFSSKDQFFTPTDTAQYCYDKCCKLISYYGDDLSKFHFIEPSAGNGNFLNVLPHDKRIGLDIEPRNSEIIQQDFLSWEPPYVFDKPPYVVIGNPPFGLRGNLALRFMNKSYPFADYVCFILPQLFESDGKGSTRKRVKFNLIHNEKLQSVFYDPNNRVVKVECIFQIWSKYHTNSEYDLIERNNKDVTIYSLSDGGSSSSTRNKSKLNSCDVYLPSTCYGKTFMRAYNSFEELPNRRGYGIIFHNNKSTLLNECKNIEWYKIAFLSTNSALNLRRSSILQQISPML